MTKYHLQKNASQFHNFSFPEKFKPRVRNGIGRFEYQKQGFDFGTRKDKIGIVKKFERNANINLSGRKN